MVIFENINEKIEQVKIHPFFKDYLDLYKERFEEYEKSEIPTLNFTDFICYKEKGTRHEYENKYFEKRDRLVTSFILYLIYDEEKYYNMLIDSMWAICNEVTWVVPAHLPMDRVKSYDEEVDLFCAETGAYLAEIIYLKGDKLPKELKELVLHYIDRRILTPFEKREFWWEKLKSNWAAVCGGSVGMTYMMVAPHRFEAVKERLLKVMDSFLSGYGDDGCCIEGPAYWLYGFGYFIYFADMLYKFTDGKDDLLHLPKVKNIALYMQSVIMRKDIVVSFSDGGPVFSGREPGLYSYLYKMYGADVPMIRKEIYPRKSSWCKMAYRVRDFLWTEPEHCGEGKKDTLFVKYYEDAKWYVAKKEKYSFAAKAGHNNEEHNHNDIGSFIIADDNGQILVDIGCMEYTKENFMPEKRYTYLNNSSLGHSVPIVDSKPQPFGEEYCGEVIKADEEGFVLDIAKAYEADISKLVRSFEMGEDSVTLTDTFEKPSGVGVTERFVSHIKPEKTAEGVRIANTLIKTDLEAEISHETLVAHGGEKKVDVYLIDYTVSSDSFRAEIVIGE